MTCAAFILSRCRGRWICDVVNVLCFLGDKGIWDICMDLAKVLVAGAMNS